MLFKIYTKNPVQRNIQYTGYFNTLTSENLENYDVNVKFVSERTIKVFSNKIFYYAFSQNQTKTNYSDSWRTISIRYVSNTTFELTLKRINILNKSENVCYSATASRWDYLKTVPTNTRILWENLLTKQNLSEPDAQVFKQLKSYEIPIFEDRTALFIQTAQELYGEMSLSGTTYNFSTIHRSKFSYLIASPINAQPSQNVDSNMYVYMIKMSEFDSTHATLLEEFLRDLSGEELFISSFIGMYTDEWGQDASFSCTKLVNNTPATVVESGARIGSQIINMISGQTFDLSGYTGNSQLGFLTIGGQTVPLLSAYLTIDPIITVGRQLLAISSCFTTKEIMRSLPYENFVKIFNENVIIVDIFSQAILSKTNLSDYYSNPYAQKYLKFQMFNNYLKALPHYTESDSDYTFATKTIKSGINLYGTYLNNKSTEYRAKTTYNSASASDFAKISDIKQNQQTLLITVLPEISSDSGSYMQPIALAKTVEKLFENYSGNFYHSITGERVDWTAKTLNMTAIKFGYNPQTILGFYKGELGNKILNNETISFNEIADEDKITANEGVWLPIEQNELLQLLTLI